VYVSVYYILPRFIETKKYGRAIIAFVILFAVCTLINHQGAKAYYHYSQVDKYKDYIILGYLNTTWAMIISGFAICISVTEKWYAQKREIEAINQQKKRNELTLRKNKMHPGFLYNTLDGIYNDIKENRGSSSSMILVLSNLLSYSLYDSKIDRVTLQHELNAVTDYISLEKMKTGQVINLNIDLFICKEEIMVPPMIILSKLHDGIASAIIITQEDDELIIRIDFKQQPAEQTRIKKIYKTEYEFA
jgi:LytS/YehU family sensor histidine kinase